MGLPTGALQYPFIRLPDHDHDMLRLLLYWDDVATIVPDIWFHGSPRELRTLLGDFTFDLYEAGYVTAAVPRYELGPHLTPFVDHLDALPESSFSSRRASLTSEGVLVHKGKFADTGLEERLIGLGLARPADSDDLTIGGPWMWMVLDPVTCREFMALLALLASEGTSGFEFHQIGHTEDGSAGHRRVPVTGDPTYLVALTDEGPASGERTDFSRDLDSARSRVLSELFPVPSSPVTTDWIVDFKSRHGELLQRFRLAVERKILDALRSPSDPQRRRWALNLATDEILGQVTAIEEALADSNIRLVEKVSFAALKNLPGVGWLFGTGKEIADAIGERRQLPGRVPDPDFAYGFFARAALAT